MPPQPFLSAKIQLFSKIQAFAEYLQKKQNQPHFLRQHCAAGVGGVFHTLRQTATPRAMDRDVPALVYRQGKRIQGKTK